MGENLQTDRKRIQCHFCGKFGHMQRECRKKQGVCLRCGVAGHQVRDCPQGRIRQLSHEGEQAEELQGFVEDL